MEEDIKNLQRFIDKCKLRGYEFYGILHPPHFEMLQKLINKHKELEKMVELMASFIEVAELDEDIAKTYCKNEACTEVDGCRECIKDYFKKKASEENE